MLNTKAKFLMLGISVIAVLAVALTTLRTPEESAVVYVDKEVPETHEGLSKPTSGKYRVTRLTLSDSQVITFDVPVMSGTINLLLADLKVMEDSGVSDAYLLIDSPGGSALDGSRLIDYMKSSKMKVHTVCVSLCASMAAQIHQQGATRLMHTKSTLMFHRASSQLQGSLEQMDSQLEWIKRYVDRLDLEVASRAQIDYSKFKGMVAGELWMEGPDAVEGGFSDGLVYIDQSVEAMLGRTISRQAAQIGLQIDPSFVRSRRLDFTY